MADERFSKTAYIVGDDIEFSHYIADNLNLNASGVNVVCTHDRTMARYDRVMPDLVILNIDCDPDWGFERLRQLRAHGDVPIIVIGQNNNKFDKVSFLERGADDFLNRPVDMRELSARIGVILRRRELQSSKNQRKVPSGKWRFGGWEIWLKSRQLHDPQGALVPLTKGEYALLLALVEAAGQPLTRENLLHATRIHGDIFDRSIDVQILRLRRKLSEYIDMPELIQTKRGVGYVFTLPAERV